MTAVFRRYLRLERALSTLKECDYAEILGLG